MAQRHWLAACLLVCSACATSSDDDDNDDAGRDAASRDVGAVLDTGGDSDLPDSGSQDTGADAGADDTGASEDSGDGEDSGTEPVCGNGVVEGDEQCDDGNRTNGDGCEADCTLPGGADAGSDTTPDAGEDTTPDVGADTTPDVGEDTTPDVGEDTTPDVGEDTTPDVGAGAGTCADPIVAGVGTLRATPLQDELSPSCLSIDQEEAVFVFTPASSGTWCFDSRGSGANDTIVSVRTTCGDVDSELGCFDDFGSPGDDDFTFQGLGSVSLTGGTPVYAIVDVYNPGASSEVSLTVSSGSCGAPPDGGGGDGGGDPVELACTDGADDGALGAGAVGDTFLVACPAGCADGVDVVYGTDVYSDDSPVCRAAVHAGASSNEAGGRVVVEILDGQDTYPGSERNGVTTRTWDLGWDRSFSTSPAP